MKMASYPPKVVKNGICQQVILEGEKVDLNRLPLHSVLATGWGLSSGQVMDEEAAARVCDRERESTSAFGGIFTRDPVEGTRNIGMYRVQQFEARKCAMHGICIMMGPRHFRMWQARGEKCRWRLCWGVSRCCRTRPQRRFRRGLRNFWFAGFLNGGGIELVQCKTIDMQVAGQCGDRD